MITVPVLTAVLALTIQAQILERVILDGQRTHRFQTTALRQQTRLTHRELWSGSLQQEANITAFQTAEI